MRSNQDWGVAACHVRGPTVPPRAVHRLPMRLGSLLRSTAASISRSPSRFVRPPAPLHPSQILAASGRLLLFGPPLGTLLLDRFASRSAVLLPVFHCSGLRLIKGTTTPSADPGV